MFARIHSGNVDWVMYVGKDERGNPVCAILCGRIWDARKLGRVIEEAAGTCDEFRPDDLGDAV